MDAKLQRDRLIDLVNQLEVLVYEPLYDDGWTKMGHWDYVSYSIDTFLQHVDEAHRILGRVDGLKFVDVGCGLGTKVHLAGTLFDAHGIELNDKYAAVARNINRRKKFFRHGRYKVQPGRAQIFQADALKHDYGQYDVIYYFRPMCDDKMERQLERRIWRQAKNGAIVIPVYAIGKFPETVHHLPTPSQLLYMKMENAALAGRRVQKIRKMFS